MSESFTAFSDELTKISQEGQESVTRDRLRRAVLTAVPGAAAFGVGTGLGALVGRYAAPKLVNTLSPMQLAALGGTLGGGVSLATLAAKRRFDELVSGRTPAQPKPKEEGNVSA
jgi:hypothetical protein